MHGETKGGNVPSGAKIPDKETSVARIEQHLFLAILAIPEYRFIAQSADPSFLSV